MLDEMKHLQASLPRLHRFAVMDYATVYSLKSHRSLRNELLFILDGRVTLHLGKDLQFNAMRGDLLLIPADTWHRDEFTPRRGLRVLFLAFDWDEPEFFRTVNNLVLIGLDDDIRSEVQRRLEFMRMNWREDSPEARFHTEIQLHGILLLLYFGAVSSPKAPAGDNRLMHKNMDRAKHFILRNRTSPITLADAAAAAGMNASYFSKRFALEFGINFSPYLTAARLELARHLLLNSTKQVAEIAALCGFSSGSYFIRVFKKHFGKTPGAYAEIERRTVGRNS